MKVKRIKGTYSISIDNEFDFPLRKVLDYSGEIDEYLIAKFICSDGFEDLVKLDDIEVYDGDDDGGK